MLKSINSNFSAPTNNKWTFFLIWKSICHNIDGILFWGFSHSDRHLYPRVVDGLGLRRSDDLNKVLISKLGWSGASNADKTWVHLLKFKYLQDWRNQRLPSRKELTTQFHCLTITRVCLYHLFGLIMIRLNTNILYMDWSMGPYNPRNQPSSRPHPPCFIAMEQWLLRNFLILFIFFTPIQPSTLKKSIFHQPHL